MSIHVKGLLKLLNSSTIYVEWDGFWWATCLILKGYQEDKIKISITSGLFNDNYSPSATLFFSRGQAIALCLGRNWKQKDLEISVNSYVLCYYNIRKFPLS